MDDRSQALAAPAKAVPRGNRRRIRAATLTVGAVALLLVGVSVAVGANPLGPAELWSGLLGRGAEATAVVQGGRIPRTVLAVAIGAALGLAGAIMQSVTRNALADPGLLGVNAGASAAVVTAISVLGLTRPSEYLGFAFLGAAAASVLLYVLGSAGGVTASPVRLTLAGVALTSALSAYITGVILVDPQAYSSFRYWDIGALTGRSLVEVAPAMATLLVGLVVGLTLGRSLDVAVLGDELSVSLGASRTRIRVLAIVAVTLLCGSATAAVGPIAFVGLAAPHIARALIGPGHRALLPLAALVGAALLTGADSVGRVIAWPQEVGVGLTIGVVGVPILVYLVRRRRSLRV